MTENGEDTVYICPVCFKTCETEEECHAHKMIECDPGKPGDERRKPVRDRYGNLVSRAPRWFLEAIKAFPAWTPFNRKD